MAKGKKDDIRERFRRFVDNLDEKTARHELVMAYMQMERCQRILEGKDVSPVTMMDNGLSSDLELFYMCKKRMEELEQAQRKGGPGLLKVHPAYDRDMFDRIDRDFKTVVRLALDELRKNGSLRFSENAVHWKSCQPLIDRYEREFERRKALISKKEFEKNLSKERSPYYLDEICLIFLNDF